MAQALSVYAPRTHLEMREIRRRAMVQDGMHRAKLAQQWRRRRLDLDLADERHLAVTVKVHAVQYTVNARSMTARSKYAPYTIYIRPCVYRHPLDAPRGKIAHGESMCVHTRD